MSLASEILGKRNKKKKRQTSLNKIIEEAKEFSKRKKIPYYIVKQVSSNGTIYRVHDIYTSFCWSSLPTLKDALHAVARGLVIYNRVSSDDIYRIISDLGISFAEKNKYLHYSEWTKTFKPKDKEIPYNHRIEYQMLLDSDDGTYTRYCYYSQRTVLYTVELLDFDTMKRGVDTQCRLIKAHQSIFNEKKRRKRKSLQLRQMLLNDEEPLF